MRYLIRLGALSFSLLCLTFSVTGAESESPQFEELEKIDFHSHIFEDVPGLAAMLRRINLRIVNVCNRGTDRDLLQEMEEMAEHLFASYGKDVLPFGSTIDLTRRDEPTYSAEVIDWLDRSFEAGAVLVKIWKDVGLELKTKEGTFLLPDDPRFDPIYSHIASRGRPLLAHLAEPLAAWLPLDPENVHYGYYSTHPEWHLYGKSEFPSHQALMDSRDRILERHPELIMVGAHMGSMSHDVDEVSKRLDRYPNFYVECSARTADLTRQAPGKVRDFFVKYQDRVMYGLDMTRDGLRGAKLSASEAQEFVRNLEDRYRRDFQYYAGEGKMEYRGKEVECLNLPLEVLEKFYSKNALRLLPTLR